MTEAALLDLLRPGVRAYVSAGSAEPLAFAELLTRHPDRMAGVELIGSFVPGVNGFDYAGLHPQARVATLLMPGVMRPSFKAGGVDVLAMSYTGLADYLERLPPDLAIVQVTPPDRNGLCSLGPAADFAPIAWKGARQRIAFVNPELPRPPGGWTIPTGEIDLAIPCEHAPLPLGSSPVSDVLRRVALNAASLIEDGDTLQAGIGGAPAAALLALKDRRGLVLHSGMVSDEAMVLAQAGALAERDHRTGIAIGSAEFYDWLPQAHGLSFVPTHETHGVLALSQTRRLAAINSALEVDLFGQANLEWRGGKLVSGIGGAPDFLAGARVSPGGRSIVALPATAKNASRIVARIDAPSVSIPRNMIDIVVTEHGIADIRDRPIEQRAQLLIGIAAPEHRSGLQEQWERIRDGL